MRHQFAHRREVRGDHRRAGGHRLEDFQRAAALLEVARRFGQWGNARHRVRNPGRQRFARELVAPVHAIGHAEPPRARHERAADGGRLRGADHQRNIEVGQARQRGDRRAHALPGLQRPEVKEVSRRRACWTASHLQGQIGAVGDHGDARRRHTHVGTNASEVACQRRGRREDVVGLGQAALLHCADALERARRNGREAVRHLDRGQAVDFIDGGKARARSVARFKDRHAGPGVAEMADAQRAALCLEHVGERATVGAHALDEVGGAGAQAHHFDPALALALGQPAVGHAGEQGVARRALKRAHRVRDVDRGALGRRHAVERRIDRAVAHQESSSAAADSSSAEMRSCTRHSGCRSQLRQVARPFFGSTRASPRE